MWKNFEREKKDSEDSFKAEMCKMEYQKRDLKETVAKYWAIINGLEEQKWEWSQRRDLRWSRPGWDSSTLKTFAIQGSSWTRKRRNKYTAQGQSEPGVWHCSLSGAKEEIRGASAAHT